MYKGNKLEANLILKEGQTLSDAEKKAIGTFLIESIQKSTGETKKIAFIAFRDESCTLESLTKYLKDPKFESFIDYKLEKASVSFLTIYKNPKLPLKVQMLLYLKLL